MVFLCLVTLNRWTGNVSFLFLVVNSSVRLDFCRSKQQKIWFNFVLISTNNIQAAIYTCMIICNTNYYTVTRYEHLNTNAPE